MRACVAVLLAVSLVCVAGCHPKKATPLESEQELARKRQEAAELERRQAEELERQAKAIQPVEEKKEAALTDIHFDFDRYNLTDEAAGTLARNAEYLMKHPEIKVLVEGHCDERGTEEYNLALGEKRAIAARDFLLRFGIDRARVSVVSYGEEQPLDPSSNEEAWAKNRRDHFVAR